MYEVKDSRAASLAAQHATRPSSLCVAPTDARTAFNVIRIPLLPIACWRLADPAFAFDSSFVAPSFREEIAKWAALVQSNAGCPAAIFAHADPVGSDDVNKTISDRRAIAVYALLTRQPAMWEDLYSGPIDGDAWGKRALQTMLQTVVGRPTDDDGNALAPGNPYYAGAIDGEDGPETTGAVKQFQTDSGLAVDGDAGPNTRKVLFGAYMDALRTPAAVGSSDATASSSEGAAPFQMQVKDFLGGDGAAAGDLPKMSLQGCSRFNPTVLLTSDEVASSETELRNAHNAPNRRVVLFLFPAGTKFDPNRWPCPKVKDSPDACKAVFWSNGEQRRQNGTEARLYRATRNTMACRFYDRFARRSPCEIGDLGQSDYPFSV